MDPLVISWFLQITTFSMFPLLVKDGLTLPYFATSFIFYLICNMIANNLTERKFTKILRIVMHISYAIGIILALCHLYASVPDKLPHLYPVLISFYSFAHFILFNIYFNYQQLCKR